MPAGFLFWSFVNCKEPKGPASGPPDDKRRDEAIDLYGGPPGQAPLNLLRPGPT